MPLSKITNPFLATPNTRISSNAANTINVSVGASNPSIYISGYYIDAANNFGRIGINNSNPTRALDISGAVSAEMNFTQGGTVQANGKVWNIVVDSGGASSNANFTLRRLTDDGNSEVSGGGFGFNISGTTGIFSTNANRKISPASVPAGSIIQTKWTDLGSGSASGTSSSPVNSGFTQTFTPLYSNSKIIHIITIGFYAICDGRFYIYRNGTNITNSLADSSRVTYDWYNDMAPITVTSQDTPGSTSLQTYVIWVSASGCTNTYGVGSSGDFNSSWLTMEIAV